MADIATVWRDGAGDWLVDGASLAADDGLQTAVLQSLFTHRLAERDDDLAGAAGNYRGRRGGWWGDAYATVADDKIGSRLWQLRRQPLTVATLRRAREYAEEALQCLIDDGVARGVSVTAERLGADGIALGVQVLRSDKPVAQYRFDLFWKGA